MTRNLFLVIATLLISGCSTFNSTLKNDRGETVVCEASGFGLMSGVLAKSAYDTCVVTARSQGFKEGGH